jgi:menaquinone-9 beta-reductase
MARVTAMSEGVVRLPASVDVLVVGMGPAGSATAAHLARAGCPVLAVDRAEFPRDKACSEYLSPEAVRLLDRLGVLADLEPSGAPLTGTTVHGPGGARLTGRFALAPVTPWRPAGLSVARRILDARLVEAARQAGAYMVERHAVADLLYDRGGVAGAVLRRPDGTCHPVRARVVVGADGLRSAVARRLGRRRYGRPSRLALVAHVADVPGLHGVAEMHVGREGYVGLNRITLGGPSGAVANVALVIPRHRATEMAGRTTQFFFEELERHPGVAGRVRPDRMVRQIMITGPFAAWSGRVTAEGALLVGDAADFFDPFTGQGIFGALRGAELAATVILEALARRGPVTRTSLAAYPLERRRLFGGKWIVERLVGYAMWFPALFDRAVARLERHGLADTFIGVTGDFVPAGHVLDFRFLARMVF